MVEGYNKNKTKNIEKVYIWIEIWKLYVLVKGLPKIYLRENNRYSKRYEGNVQIAK